MGAISAWSRPPEPRRLRKNRMPNLVQAVHVEKRKLCRGETAAWKITGCSIDAEIVKRKGWGLILVIHVKKPDASPDYGSITSIEYAVKSQKDALRKLGIVYQREIVKAKKTKVD